MTSQTSVTRISANADAVSPLNGLGLENLVVPEIDVLFRHAERVDRESAWFEHVPFAHWLIRAARPRLLVELGTHAGVSYAAFCQAVQAEELGTRCYAVDTWRGDDHAGHYSEEVFSDLSEYHDRRYAAFSQMLRCTFDDARNMFLDSSIDLLHIDGFHTYEAVKSDFEGWLPKLSGRAVVLFHDTNERRDEFGVWRLWAEISEKWPAFEFAHGHGLGVLCVGTEVPDALRALCSLPENAAAIVRSRFARLGERWAMESRAITLGRGVAARDLHIANLEATVRTAEAARADAVARATAMQAEVRAQAEVAEASWTAHGAARDMHIANLEETVRRVEAARAGAVARATAMQAEVREQAEVAEASRAAEVTAKKCAATAEKLADTLRTQIIARRHDQDVEIARLRQQSESNLVQLHAVTLQARQAAQERDALLSSTAWLVTWPARWLADAMPSSVRWHSRRALKAAWWAATPWGMPRRLQKIRHRNQRATFDVLTKSLEHRDHDGEMDAKVQAPVHEVSYERWIKEYESHDQLPPIVRTESHGSGEIRFSFLLASVGQPTDAEATLKSLQAQASSDWELLVPVSGLQPAWLAGNLRAEDARLVPVSCAADADKGEMLKILLSAAQGQWIAVLDAGDILAPKALDYVQHALAQLPEVALLYADEDEILPNRRRQAPLFKPNWSPELLQAFNYFGRLTLLSRALVVQVGGFVAGDGAGAEWGLNLRAADAAVSIGLRIERVAHVLCHRAWGGDRDRPAPATAAAAQQRAMLRAFWASRGVQATVETQPDGTQRSSWDIADPPLVSVIIPNRNSPELLRRCLEDVLDHTTYSNVEVIIVENRSDDVQTWQLYEAFERRNNVRVIRVDRSFNYSAACNRGAALASGALLLFLNNDIEVIDPRWLGELVRMAMLPGVGIVGTKLRYPDGTLQHAGVAVGIHLYGLMFHHSDEAAWGVFGSPNHTRNWSAIMGACQMVRREVFDLAGGFNEAYQIANSDIALCLQAQRAGWRTAYTPFAALVHHEGMTRGHTNPARDMMRSAREVQRLGLVEDPYLHPQLSGLDSTPRLRAPGEQSLREILQVDLVRNIGALPGPEAPLDLFDNLDIEKASGLNATEFCWPPQPAEFIKDPWSAARWILDLLRSRTDLRRRFPRALSDGACGSFATWIAGAGGCGLGLSNEARCQVTAAFEIDPPARPRQYYSWREDLRVTFPLGLLPAGRRNFTTWMLQHRQDGKLRLEEVWWLLLQCAEDPAGELVRTYLFTPAWQEAHPYGLTLFGCDRFAAWLSNYYDLPEDAGWLKPQNWPVSLSAEEQVRLAYAARDDWRSAHPHAFESEPAAYNFLAWLGTDAVGLPQEVRAWCALRLADGTAARLAAPGANIIGHFCYPSGLRVSVEAMAESIELAGGTISRRDVRTDTGDDPHHLEIGGLESHDITIIHTQPEPFFDTSFVRSDLAERTPRTYRVAYWYWELEAVPAYWAEKALAVDEIWAATNFVADALRSVSPVPVRTLFPGVRIGSFRSRSRQAFGLRGREEGRFAFLFSFHMGSVMERKNPLGLVRAFRQAFAPEEPVDLVLKTTSFNRQHAAQVTELRAAAEGANITLLDQVLTPDETLSLMDACDAYVSLHRSEGLGLTMAEAMLLGKPVIATRYSGNLDFMDDRNSLLVDYDLVQLGRPVPPYDAASHWAEPSTDHAAQLMRRLYSDQSWARELGAAAQHDAQARLSLMAAGQRFAERLAEIKANRYRREPASRNGKGVLARNVDIHGVPV